MVQVALSQSEAVHGETEALLRTTIGHEAELEAQVKQLLEEVAQHQVTLALSVSRTHIPVARLWFYCMMESPEHCFATYLAPYLIKCISLCYICLSV